MGAAESVASGGRRVKSAEALEAELQRLPGLDQGALRQRFETVYGSVPPVRLSPYLLRLAIAHRLQEQVYGGLSNSLRLKLIAGEFHAPAKTGVGTVLVREWQGVHHTVTVLQNGVEYRGTLYRSLSELAQLISGVKRSGPDFFGLKALQKKKP